MVLHNAFQFNTAWQQPSKQLHFVSTSFESTTCLQTNMIQKPHVHLFNVYNVTMLVLFINTCSWKLLYRFLLLLFLVESSPFCSSIAAVPLVSCLALQLSSGDDSKLDSCFPAGVVSMKDVTATTLSRSSSEEDLVDSLLAADSFWTPTLLPLIFNPFFSLFSSDDNLGSAGNI